MKKNTQVALVEMYVNCVANVTSEIKIDRNEDIKVLIGLMKVENLVDVLLEVLHCANEEKLNIGELVYEKFRLPL